MLASEIKARELRIVDDIVMSNVWHNPSNPVFWDTNELFSALLKKNSVVHHLLHLRDFSERMPSSESHHATNSQLADTVLEIAKHHAHDAINEVHLFLALLTRYPYNFEGHFASLQTYYRREFPHGTKRHQNLLRVAKESGDASWITRVEHSIDETPLCQARVTETLERYLSATYYPFGPKEWQKYSAQKNAGNGKKEKSLSDYSLIAFASHRLRDERPKL